MNCEALLEDYIQDAFDIVSAWDLNDEDFAHAVNDQARLMSGIPLDYLPFQSLPDSYAALQF